MKRETLRTLSGSQMGAAAGGLIAVYVNTNYCITYNCIVYSGNCNNDPPPPPPPYTYTK